MRGRLEKMFFLYVILQRKLAMVCGDQPAQISLVFAFLR